jgi:hypothetical protein
MPIILGSFLLKSLVKITCLCNSDGLSFFRDVILMATIDLEQSTRMWMG